MAFADQQHRATFGSVRASAAATWPITSSDDASAGLQFTWHDTDHERLPPDRSHEGARGGAISRELHRAVGRRGAHDGESIVRAQRVDESERGADGRLCARGMDVQIVDDEHEVATLRRPFDLAEVDVLERHQWLRLSVVQHHDLVRPQVGDRLAVARDDRGNLDQRGAARNVGWLGGPARPPAT